MATSVLTPGTIRMRFDSKLSSRHHLQADSGVKSTEFNGSSGRKQFLNSLKVLIQRLTIQLKLALNDSRLDSDSRLNTRTARISVEAPVLWR